MSSWTAGRATITRKSKSAYGRAFGTNCFRRHYSNIKLTKKFGVEDALNFFKVEPIGKTNNVETHLFQVSSTGELDTAIVEWTAFDDDVYNAFVPYYPLLTTDTADVYKYSPAKVVRSDEQPTEGVWYKDQKGRYYTYPEDWTKSFYGARDLLSGDP